MCNYSPQNVGDRKWTESISKENGQEFFRPNRSHYVKDSEVHICMCVCVCVCVCSESESHSVMSDSLQWNSPG